MLSKKNPLQKKEKSAETAENRRQFETERKYHTKYSDPYLKHISVLEEKVPILDNSLQQMNRAVETGNVEGIMPFLATALHLDPLYNSDLASFMTASKEHFLSAIKRAGTRPNQWIEQQILSAYAKPGRSKEANLSSLALTGFEDDVAKKEVEIARRIEAEHGNQYGYSRKDIEALTRKELKNYADARQDLLSYQLRKIAEKEMTLEDFSKIKKVPQGTALTPKMSKYLMSVYKDPHKAEAVAKKMGFDIYPDEFYETFE